MPEAPSNPQCGRSLRIAHLTTVDMSLALLLATELEVDLEEGHAVVGMSAPGPYVERVTALGVEHVPVPSLTRSWRPLADLRAFAEITRAVRRLRLDVLHTHNPKTGVMGRVAGRLARVPVVVNTCHGLWAKRDDPFAKRALVYLVEAVAAQFSDAELFQNAEDLATLRPVLRRRRSRVVGNGVDLQRFAPDADAGRSFRSDLGISDDTIVVGAVGRQVREKGMAEFAYAAERLARRAAFLWIGPEDAVDPGARADRSPAVRYVGERSDMAGVYAALDVFALPSYREGLSRSAMEASACGRPMVLTDIRGCREIGTDDEHLLLVPPGDGPALARAIERLIEKADLRARLGAAARERALTAFDQRAVARQSLTAYAEVAQRKGLAWRP